MAQKFAAGQGGHLDEHNKWAQLIEDLEDPNTDPDKYPSLQGPPGPPGPEGPEGPQGPVGDGLQIVGVVDTLAELPDPATYEGRRGDIIVVHETEHGYSFNPDVPEWIDAGPIGGPEGPQGPKGDSFEYEDFTPEQLEGLKGDQGDKGDKGDPGDDIELPDPAAAGLILTSTEDSYEWAEPAPTGIDIEATRANTVIQSNDALDWTEGMSIEVLSELPADTSGYEDGDIVVVPSEGVFVKQGADWVSSGGTNGKSLTIYEYLATEGQTAFSGEDLNGLFMSFTDGLTQVYLNGVMLSPGDDYSTSSNEVTLLAGAAADDVLNVVAFSSFQSADHYTKAESDAKFATKTEVALKVDGNQGIDAIVALTEAEYEALETPNPTTLYVVTE